MRQALPLLIVLAILAGVVVFWFFLRDDPLGEALRDRQLATRRLAESVVKAGAGKRALIISNPFAEKMGGRIQQQEEAGIRGIREGLGDRIAVEGVVYPQLFPEAEKDPRSVEMLPGTTTPLSFLVTDDSFDQLAASHPTCDLMISLIGVPANLKAVSVWQQAGSPRFALLLPDLRLFGDAAAVKESVKSGKLAAFVIAKPTNSRDADGAKASFDSQFLLVTAENVDRVFELYPNLIAAGASGW